VSANTKRVKRERATYGIAVLSPGAHEAEQHAGVPVGIRSRLEQCVPSVLIPSWYRVVPWLDDDALSLLEGAKALHGRVLGVKPHNGAARAILIGGFYPIRSASRDNGVTDHAQSMARDGHPTNGNPQDYNLSGFKLTHYPRGTWPSRRR
jgi:hypothetical protein